MYLRYSVVFLGNFFKFFISKANTFHRFALYTYTERDFTKEKKKRQWLKCRSLLFIRLFIYFQVICVNQAFYCSVFDERDEKNRRKKKRTQIVQ